MPDKVKVSQIKMCALICEQDYSLNSMDIFSDTIKSAFKDSDIAQAFNVRRTKATAIIKHVMGGAIFDELLNLLTKTDFKNFQCLWMRQLMAQLKKF
jgi:hypothetical protein